MHKALPFLADYLSYLITLSDELWVPLHYLFVLELAELMVVHCISVTHNYR
jgi:hypothetical protein